MMCLVQANFLDSDAVNPSMPVVTVFLRLKLITAMERATTEIGQTAMEIRQSGITNTVMTRHLETVDGVTTQLDTQKDLAKSLASILAKVDVFVTLIDDLSAVSRYLTITGIGAH